ncbi:autotransporter-associated beta strand repeat-containing protein [Polynucleobacter necessarius]|uniref:autotransporter-associated beta strand repeat-containing protein n=1 Tax=Polynucleobacter necessarius TaxID=576610 RepID=UPI000E094E52|nr:autotransporter-associated beta strand repeat-containing protein [Polynucleobacter necessarius]
MRFVSSLKLYATGAGGGITLNSSQNLSSGTYYDVYVGSGFEILANGGAIQLLGGQNSGTRNGLLYTGATSYLGSKASSSVATSSSNITISYDEYEFNFYTPKVATTGQVAWKAVGADFKRAMNTSWFDWNQNGQTMTGLTIGSETNSKTITVGAAISVNGPITLNGPVVLTYGLTTSNTATGDITIAGSTVTGSGAISIAPGKNLTFNLSGNDTFGGIISGSSSTFTKQGVGSLYLTDVSTYTGGTTISGGYLELNTTGGLYSSGNIVNDSQLGFNQNADITFSGTISGTGSIIKYATNTLTLSGLNTYAGLTTISAGTLAW